MTFSDTTEKGQSEALRFELDLRHAPEKVWRAITEPKLLSEWLLPVIDLKLERGAAFMFKTQPIEGWDGTVSCRVIEVDAPRKLSYAWVVGETIDTVVTFTLAPSASGTQMTIVQSGFTQKQNFGGARYGWRMMSEKLVDLLGRIS